jgi:hypothetical protein
MPNIDFSDEEHAAVTATVRRTIADDKYPLSPRLAPLKAALAWQPLRRAMPALAWTSKLSFLRLLTRPSFPLPHVRRGLSPFGATFCRLWRRNRNYTKRRYCS